MKHPAEKQREPGARAVRAALLSGPAGLLACGFGAGLAPLAPGTAGTVLAIPFALVLWNLAPPWPWLILGAMSLLGVYVCGVASRGLGAHDHPAIVWDEMVGYWLSVACVPLTWPWLLAAFVLFRLFDILKPWPISLLDQKVPGGIGIMIDDIVAAFYAMALLAMARVILV